MAFQPIHAFNNKLDLKDAYGWDAAKILTDFLSKVAAKPEDYGAPADRKTDFKLLYDHIDALKFPNGTSYVAPTPEQQILRNAGKPPTLNPTQAIKWTANTHEERYFILFDLLGVFLSLMGPAPATATSKNYFLPLVVVYARWCGKLARSKGFTPAVAQITWTSKAGSTALYSFLGTSAQGYVKDEQWKTLVGKTRHDYLNSILQAPYKEFGTSPSITNNSKSGTNFGNCAETYPFLYILADNSLAQNTFGIALKIASTTGATYDGESYWKEGPILPPCELNCQQLMKWYGVFGRLAHFELWKT